MSSETRLAWTAGYLATLGAIVVIDAWLGPTAEYLNAYEIVRRTFPNTWPEVTPHYLFRGDRLGQAQLAVGWFAFLVEVLLAEGLVYGAFRLIRLVGASAKDDRTVES